MAGNEIIDDCGEYVHLHHGQVLVHRKYQIESNRHAVATVRDGRPSQPSRGREARLAGKNQAAAGETRNQHSSSLQRDSVEH
jgi:hypothetical protein